MENQKEMVEFVKWIVTNPEEVVAAINGMSQSEEGKKSLQELFAKFKASKQKFQMGGVIPRMQYGGDTLRYTTLRPIVTTRNGYPEQIGEDRTVARRYPTYSPGTAPARSEFYTEDGYARRINGNDTTWLKRRPIAYTPAGNPENKEDANYVHIWEEVMPTSWLRAMFNREPDSVESPDVVDMQQRGGRILGVTHSGYRNGRHVLVPGQTHEYFDSYTVEGPSDDRIEAIVQTEYPHGYISRIKDRPDSKPVYMGDKFGPFGLLDQDSLRNAWDSLINLKTTYPNIENRSWNKIKAQQNGGTVSRYGHKFYADAENDWNFVTDSRAGHLRNGRYYEASTSRSPEGATTERYYLGEHEQNGELKPSYYLQRDIYPRNDGPADTVWVYRIPRPHAYHFTSANLIGEPFEKVITSDGYNNMKIWGGSQDVNMGAENVKKVRDQINNIFERLNLKK